MRSQVLIIFVIIVIIGGVLGGLSILTYNNLATTKVHAEKNWATVKVQFERKIDLIPQLITIVENYTTYEQETLALIVTLRTRWLELNGSVNAQVNVSSQLNTALNTLFVAISENYPTLQASILYQNLFDEITGTENRITQAKLDFNDAVTQYNVMLATFPGNMFGALFGFSPMNLYAYTEPPS
jgi:LemA protein